MKGLVKMHSAGNTSYSLKDTPSNNYNKMYVHKYIESRILARVYRVGQDRIVVK